MYTDNEIKELEATLQLIKETKEETTDVKELEQLKKQETKVSVELISKFYRVVNHSKFDTVDLMNTIADLVSVVENKDMEPDIIFVSKRIGSQVVIQYANLVLKEKNANLLGYYKNETEFKKALQVNHAFVLCEEVGSIPEEIEAFEIVKDSAFINEHNMNLNNIKGVRSNLDFGERDYLAGFIEKLVNYQNDKFQFEMTTLEMTDIMNEYALEVLEHAKDKQVKMKQEIKNN